MTHSMRLTRRNARRVFATALVLALLTTPAAAQGPIARSVQQEAGQLAQTTIYRTEMRSPVLFWTGVAVAGAGALATVGAVTWAEQSDLRLENVNTRLGRDLAPCGTDVNSTPQPVADCKVNAGLLWFGGAMLAGGGAMMIIGGQHVQIVEVGPRAFALRVRF